MEDILTNLFVKPLTKIGWHTMPWSFTVYAYLPVHKNIAINPNGRDGETILLIILRRI